MKHFANLLTLSRVFVALFFYIFIKHIGVSSETGVWILLVCFALIELSDLLDGVVARHVAGVSDLGKLLDPLCDVTAHFLCIYALSLVHLAPSVVVVVFVVREVWVQMLRMQLLKRNVVFAAQWSGKVKTWFFGIAIFGSLLIFPNGILSSQALFLRQPIFYLYYIAAGASILSGLQYLFIALKTISAPQSE